MDHKYFNRVIIREAVHGLAEFVLAGNLRKIMRDFDYIIFLGDISVSTMKTILNCFPNKKAMLSWEIMMTKIC